MRKIVSLIVMLSFCGIIFAGGKDNLIQNDEAVVISGRDFYFANLAYKDFIENNLVKQEKEMVDNYMSHLEELSKRENWNPFKDIANGNWSPDRRDELQEYIKVSEYVSSSWDDFIRRNSSDLYEYKFEITYEKESVKVYMFIDRPSVMGGDAEYIFDYDGNIISKKYGKWFFHINIKNHCSFALTNV